MREYRQIEEMHPRDYTVVGITGSFEKFVSLEGKKFFGRPFYDIVSVIKNGQYYHGEAVGDRTEVPKAFLKRVNKNQVNLKKEFKKFEKTLSDYEQLIRLPKSKLTPDSIKQFYKYYQDLIEVAYGGMETLDVIEVLSPKKRKFFEKWALQARLRAERIYKDGETVFVPKFLQWFVSKHIPKYPWQLLNNLFFKELLNVIDHKSKLPSVSELQQRNKLFYVSQYPWSKVEMASGKKAAQIIKRRRLFDQKIKKTTSRLEGQTVYPGTATARVSIILTKKELNKYKDGNIIVAPMTDPYYLPIMKKAPAFVTDEGGVLCHAAIVARELKKPCIIGTKIATKVLKDGDLVEVDAGKGVVRKLR